MERQRTTMSTLDAFGALGLLLAAACLIIWAFGPDRFGIAAAALAATGVVLLIAGAVTRKH